MQYWRLSSFYFSYFAMIGAIVPYWTLYLTSVNFDPIQIGLLASILMGTKVVSPYLFGWLSDKFQAPVLVIRLTSFLSLISFSFIFITDTFIGTALVIASFSFFWNGQIGQFESITLSRISNDTSRYGGIRAWGSIGFIVSVLMLGFLINMSGINYLPVFMTVILLLIGLSSLIVNKSDRVVPRNEHTNFLNDFLRPNVIFFFVTCLLLQVSHGPYYTFFSIFLKDIGYSEFQISSLWALAVFAELILFLLMFKVQKFLSLKSILSISLIFSMLRWLLIFLYPNNFLMLILAQLFHAFSFGSFHAAAVQWVGKTFSVNNQGQGQAFYSAIGFGAGGAIGALISGFLWDFDPNFVWIFAFLASFLGFSSSLFIKTPKF